MLLSLYPNGVKQFTGVIVTDFRLFNRADAIVVPCEITVIVCRYVGRFLGGLSFNILYLIDVGDALETHSIAG